VPCARATPNAVELINNVTATATCSSQRVRNNSHDAALTERIRKFECVGDGISVAAGKKEEAGMIDVIQREEKRWDFQAGTRIEPFKSKWELSVEGSRSHTRTN
jgi:hypothetical protein